MTPGARLAASIELLTEIERARAAADRIAQGWFRTRRYAGSKDRRAIIDLVFEAMRERGRSTWSIERHGAEANPRLLVLAAARMPLDELDALLGSSPHAPQPLNETERKILTETAADLADWAPDWARGNFPPWLEPLLARRFGPDLRRELEALGGRAPFDVRVNLLLGQRDEVQVMLGEGGIAAEPTRYSPVGLRIEGNPRLEQHMAYTTGLVEPQDEASQLASLLVDTRPGQQVIDYCAGAGGKTLALAAAMGNKGQIYAHDSDRRRLERLKPRLQRAGARNIQIIGTEGLAHAKLQADRVLVDAPCTGTGTWRRNPEARWRLTPDVLARQQERQRHLLVEAAQWVKPGGRLVYCTCSVLMEENEDAISGFLASHPGFQVRSLPEVWANVLGTLCPVEGPYLRLTPAQHQTDGFFAAILERKTG